MRASSCSQEHNMRRNSLYTGDIVLTGPPNSGKTTLLKAVKELGFLTVPETAGELLQEGLLPWEEPERFDLERWQRQLRYESALPSHPRPAFLDRGLFDTVAYRRAYNQELPDYVHFIGGPRYRLMLLCAPCPWVEDGVRYEGNGDLEKALAFQALITPLLEQAYRERGVPVIKVPLLPHAQRVEYVLEAARQAIKGTTELVS
jgi:predicted ATPase